MAHKNYDQHQSNKKEMQRIRVLSGLCVACKKISMTYRCKKCAVKHSANQQAYRSRKK